MLLEDKNAVIYGAGGAVGGAVARAFAREGARVFLAGVEAVAGEISAADGTTEAAEVDALDEQAVEEHIGEVAGKARSIDVLFDAIGMEDVQGTPLPDMPLEDFVRPIVHATRTQFVTARAVAQRMVGQGSDVILTITAGPARRAFPNVGGFDTACAAIEGLWRSSGLTASVSPSWRWPGRRMRRTYSRRSNCTPGQRANHSRKSWPIRAAAPCWDGCRRCRGGGRCYLDGLRSRKRHDRGHRQRHLRLHRRLANRDGAFGPVPNRTVSTGKVHSWTPKIAKA